MVWNILENGNTKDLKIFLLFTVVCEDEDVCIKENLVKFLIGNIYFFNKIYYIISIKYTCFSIKYFF